MTAPLFESDRLIYKALSPDHCTSEYVSWLNDPEVYKYLETGGNYTETLLKQFLLENEKKKILFWAIHIKSDGSHIGNIKIDPVSARHGTGEYGIMMGKRSEWGKGYAKEATLRICNFCFDALNLRKITLGVVSENHTAFELYKKAGFETEGVYRNHVNYHGTYYDIIRMAKFNPSFIP